MTASATWSIDLTLDGFAPVQPQIVEFLSSAGVQGRASYVSQLVVEEIVRNLIQHAQRSPASEPATVEVEVSGDRVKIRIEDAELPFDPDDAPPFDATAPLEARRSGGMGLHLVRSMADELLYERLRDRNRLTIGVARP